MKNLEENAAFVGSDIIGAGVWNQYEQEFTAAGCFWVYFDDADGAYLHQCCVIKFQSNGTARIFGQNSF